MWVEILRIYITRIRRTNDCRIRKLSDCNMIGMPVIAIGRKCNNDLWLDAPNVTHDLCDDFGKKCLIHFSINVVQEIEAFHTQFLDRVLQFPRADFAESPEAGILLFGPE